MESRKFHWWILLIPIVLVGIILAAVFWDAILIRIVPKTVLRTAISEVISQLDMRFQEDPLLILVHSIEPEGKYTADVQLSTDNKLLGTVNYDMKVQSNGKDHQLYAEGIATASDMQLNLSWYMDEEFMAVSSEELVKGRYYGITYDTFSEDIRSIPLLNFFISDKMLAQWDGSIQNIQEQAGRNFVMPSVPEFSEDDLKTLLIGIIALPCDVEKVSISLEDTVLDCHALSYQLNGALVGQFLADTSYSENAEVTATFYLYERSLIKAQLSCASGNKNAQFTLLLGQNPVEDVLSLQGTEKNDAFHNSFVLTVDTERQEDHYTESWNYSKTSNGADSQKTKFDLDYQPSSGYMTVCFDNGEPIELMFTETGDGFQLKTDQIVPLVQAFRQGSRDPNSEEQITCMMNVSKGSEIITPVYRNLDQWSLEDFWTLLTGVGALIGIQIES